MQTLLVKRVNQRSLSIIPLTHGQAQRAESNFLATEMEIDHSKIVIYVGDVNEYLADPSKLVDAAAKLLDRNNCHDLNPGTYYTSIGNLSTDNCHPGLLTHEWYSEQILSKYQEICKECA